MTKFTCANIFILKLRTFCFSFIQIFQLNIYDANGQWYLSSQISSSTAFIFVSDKRLCRCKSCIVGYILHHRFRLVSFIAVLSCILFSLLNMLESCITLANSAVVLCSSPQTQQYKSDFLFLLTKPIILIFLLQSFLIRNLGCVHQERFSLYKLNSLDAPIFGIKIYISVNLFSGETDILHKVIGKHSKR